MMNYYHKSCRLLSIHKYILNLSGVSVKEALNQIIFFKNFTIYSTVEIKYLLIVDNHCLVV